MKPSLNQTEDLKLIKKARAGNQAAFNTIISKYLSFVRLKTRSYFMAGGDTDDLVQEGLFGLTKAINDYREDRGSSFRNFVELCITRQIITAIKSASRQKHSPLNNYLSLTHSPSQYEDGQCTLEEILEGPPDSDPFTQLVCFDKIESLKLCLTERLSLLEASVLKLNLDEYSYEEIAEKLKCTTKTVDNALQRIRRKVNNHLNATR